MKMFLKIVVFTGLYYPTIFIFLFYSFVVRAIPSLTSLRRCILHCLVLK